MSNTFRLSRKSIEKDAARLRVLLDPVASGASVSIAGAGADNRVVIWQGAASLTSSAELYFDKTNNRLGVNRGTPSSAIDVEGHAGGDVVLQTRAIAGQTGNLFQATDAAGNPLTIIDAAGNAESGAVPFVHLAAGYQLGIDGRAEFSDILARGEFRASTFAYDEIHANSGDMMIASASVLESDCVVGAATPSTDDLAVALFSADDTTPNTGDTVTFTSACVGGAVTGYSWDCNGDGVEDYATQNCAHVYDTAGVYDVTLTVTSAAGVNFHTRTNYITVTETPVVASRVTDALVHIWDFSTGAGAIVYDSGPGVPLNLTIYTPSNTAWISGALRISGPCQLLSNEAATQFIAAVKASNEITMEAWVTPATASQSAARIISLAEEYALSNCELLHSQTNYSARLRSTGTSLAGLPSLDATGSAAAEKQHVVFTCDSAGTTKIYVDSVLIASGALSGASDMSSWNDSYYLCLVNSIVELRPWLGDLHLVALYSKDLSAAEVLQNFNAGGGVVDPADVIPIADFTVDDQTINAGDTATFTDASTDAASWYWNFGDGGTSVLPNPTHVYAAAGTFTVYQTVTSSTGHTDTETKLSYMTVGTPPAGDFYVVSTTGNDANAGTEVAPWRTIQTSIAKLVAGDTLLIRGGTYYETLAISTSGTAAGYITIDAWPGETVTLDGQFVRPTGTLNIPYPDTYPGLGWSWAGLVVITGSYIKLNNITITRSRGRGIEIKGASTARLNHIEINGCTIDNTWNMSIAPGYVDYLTVNGCTMHYAGNWLRDNAKRPPTWPSAMHVTVCTYVTVSNCTIYECHTEGVTAAGCDHVTFTDNQVWDTEHTGLYVNHSCDVLFERNFVWFGTRAPWVVGSSSAPGITTVAETNPNPLIRNHANDDITIRNNIVVSTSRFILLGMQTQPVTTMDNVKIYHNTFVNPVAVSTDYHIRVATGLTLTNCAVKNNIFYSPAQSIIASGPVSQITWGDNCWYSSRPAVCTGTGDIITDPYLKTPDVARVEGTITAEHFKLLTGSPCQGVGANLAVADDYWGTARGATPDMGAHERT